MYRILIILISLAVSSRVQAQQNRAIEFPDVPGYYTLACDLHMHTVFSDGSVWPNIRVQEAHRDGLDAIAITDHLEYQPHRHDIPNPDRNRAFDVAVNSNGDHPLIVIPGSEITRSMPPGHANAIFITDANALVAPVGEEAIDAREVFEEVARQGGFAFWNHPAWTSQRSDGVAVLEDMHRELIDADLLHGIEVVNQFTYSDEALEIALANNLAIIGTSDIHGLVDWDFEVAQGGHRPVTLVLAEERTAEGIHEGLRARRTIAWHRNTLIGRESEIMPLINASITVAGAEFRGGTSILEVQLENHSDARFILRNTSEWTFHEDIDILEVSPHTTTTFSLKTLEQETPYLISFEVMNAITAPNTHPEITLTVTTND